MRLATIRDGEREAAAVRIDTAYVRLADINRAFGADWPTDVFALLCSGRLTALGDWLREQAHRIPRHGVPVVPADAADFGPLYRHPRKIWGIGLNYAAHAADLAAERPTGIPGSFMKPDTAIIGFGDAIRIPTQSEETTAEAELGVVIGATCRSVSRRQWQSVVAGFTTIIDMTAVDILKQNPRYLTLAKSFDTFFSFGPELVTCDEVDDVMALRVATWINGRVHAENTVSAMTFPPDVLVAFHSDAMTLTPGDVISTGTPGAVTVRDRDTIECRITGFSSLVNSVMDMKREKGGAV